MRHYLKSLIIAAIALYLAFTLIPTISLGKDPRNIAFVIGGLFLVANIVKPVFNLVLIPINHLTFGLVSFILNLVLILGLVKFLPGFTIGAYNFPGLVIEGLIIPPQSFNQIATLVLVALLITISQKVLQIIFS